MIRVMEVLASLKRAGAEQMAVTLACGLDRNRFETSIVSLYDAFPDGLEPLLDDCGIATWHLGKRRGFDPRIYPRLARVYRKFRPHIVHTHSYVLRYAWPAAAAGHSFRLVHTVHNLAEKEVDALGRAVHRVAFRCGVAPVAISSEVAHSFRKTYGFPPVATIPNGIDAKRFYRPEARRQWRFERGFSCEDLLVVSVARLERQKNPLGLIDAFAQALHGDAHCYLLIAGGGTMLDAAREHAASRGIAKLVHFLGVQADIPGLLSASDIFALASGWEGSPISIMEAMAAHLPVVATAVGGVPELVEDGTTGLLAPPGDSATLAEHLVRLARDPQYRRKLGEAGGAASARFDASAMTAAYGALFELINPEPQA